MGWVKVSEREKGESVECLVGVRGRWDSERKGEEDLDKRELKITTVSTMSLLEWKGVKEMSRVVEC